MTSRFRFHLQPVLDQRGRIADERQRVLAAKMRDLTEAEAEAARLHAEREAQRDALTHDHARFDVEKLRATYAHLAFLDRSIDDHAVRVAACRTEVERAQAGLIAANMDRKVLETLKTRRFEAFEAAEAQVDQREVDDQNARRYGRAQRRRGSES